MKKHRGAIAGFGKVAAEAHFPGFRQASGFEIAAVVDPSEKRRAAALAALPGVRVYADLAAALAAEGRLDFVDVATPPRLHAPTCLQALARGLHVLCEKPLALDLAEIAELRRAVRRSGRTLFTVHNWKYAPLVRRLHGLLRAGTIGETREIDWEVLRPSPPQGAAEAGWRLDPGQAGGGILVDHGWHAFYLMLFLIGLPPRSIVARRSTALGFGVEDGAECELDFGDALARIRLRWGAAERRAGGVVRGSLGEIRIEDDRLTVAPSDRSTQVTRFSPALSASSYHPEWFPALLEDFRAEMQHPDQRGRSFVEAVRVAEMMAAAYRSEGRMISLAAAERA
ncbi:MAG: Gfo/Idh/MocA family oxidoreductase [Deltaproteobacteria bacterium]|nr:Gfo/Idh/MocA family oxidoreductase [Deltaproteobacteria bacterium]